MAIQVHCPSCGVLVQAPDDAAGKIGKCPKCEHKFKIEQPAPAMPMSPPAGAPGAAPPSPPAQGFGAAPPPPAQAYVPPGMYAPPAPRPTSGLAIASLVLSLLCVTSPLGLILGIAALVRINRSRGQMNGQGLAIAGIVLSCVTLLFIVSIIAAIAIPNLLRSRTAANESTAIGTLKTIATQEAIFRQQAEVDQNGNGAGEYGLLGELAGEIALRPSTARLANPAYISQQFRTGGNHGNGVAQKSGYLFKLYLSNATSGNLEAVGDDRSLGGDTTTGGPAASAQAIPPQESGFALYAWPTEFGSTGTRAFFINEIGEVYTTKMEHAKYYGTAAMPAADAAYVKGGRAFASRISSGRTVGNDGNRWSPAWSY